MWREVSTIPSRWSSGRRATCPRRGRSSACRARRTRRAPTTSSASRGQTTPQRRLAVVGRVAGVDGAIGLVEADLTAHCSRRSASTAPASARRLRARWRLCSVERSAVVAMSARAPAPGRGGRVARAARRRAAAGRRRPRPRRGRGRGSARGERRSASRRRLDRGGRCAVQRGRHAVRPGERVDHERAGEPAATGDVELEDVAAPPRAGAERRAPTSSTRRRRSPHRRARARARGAGRRGHRSSAAPPSSARPRPASAWSSAAASATVA